MYNIIDTPYINKLRLIRRGFISPEFVLKGQQYVYGKLMYKGMSRRTAIAETANDRWQFSPGPFLSRAILITDQQGSVTGSSKRDFLSNVRTLTLNNGFQAKFFRPSVFSGEHVWASDDLGTILRIKSYPLFFRDTIAIEQVMAPAALIPLLIFLGAHLIILERRRAAR